MSVLFDTAGGIIGCRQLVALWMLLLAFVASLGAIVIAGVGANRAQVWWAGLNAGVRALVIALLVVFTVLAGQLLMARRTSIIRLYEGYWPVIRWANARRSRAPAPDSRKPAATHCPRRSARKVAVWSHGLAPAKPLSC